MGPYLHKDLETVAAVARSLGADLGALGRTAMGGPLAL